MDEKEKLNKKFVSYGSLKQVDVDKIVGYLKECGMSDDDINKAGDYKGWFHLNPSFNEKEGAFEEDLKGKGKR